MKKLLARLQALPDEMMRAASRAAAFAAERAAYNARELAPVDTGELRGSISFSAENGGAVVRAEAAHAAMVEYGTSKMPPRLYMQPAAQAAREDYFSTAKRLIQGRDKT